jgi:predicted TIM-barrel fold metal-dependent hydrolase
MTETDIPMCQGPEPHPVKARFDVPDGTIDCHAHIFGPESRYPWSPRRGYTPPDANLETYLQLLNTIGGIERAVLTQPSVYGTDNSCMLDAVERMAGRFLAVAAVDEGVKDAELEVLNERGVRGVRVNLVDPGGMPFEDIGAVRAFTERIRPLGWHLEVLIHVHTFENVRQVLGSMAVDVVVGHLGYMKADNGVDHPGFKDFLDLVRDGNCWVKTSGAYRITTSEQTPYRDVVPIARALIEANQDRIIWGTDWPHPYFSGRMPNDGALLDQIADWTSDQTLRRKILVDNPRVLYGF